MKSITNQPTVRRRFARSLLLLSIGWLIGCAEGNCRQVAADQAAASGTNPQSSVPVDIKNPLDHVRVFKYDGSLQCGQGTPISMADMQGQLKDIKVFSSSNKLDGLMHMQMCGSNAGKANVYEIDRHQLPDAMKLGFKEWLWN